MTSEESKIEARLEEVLQLILCPISACWSLHDCHFAYFHDDDDQYHFPEVWPVAVEEDDDRQGTRSRLPVVLVYQEAQGSRSVALKREVEIKTLSRQEKESLIRAAG